MRGVAGILLAGVCLAQSPAFDAASVKVVDPAHRDTARVMRGPGSADPGRIHYPTIPMIGLLANAYGVEVDRISGPAWMSDYMGPNHYVVDATMPGGTTTEQFQSMLQNLLAERFHLVVHHETRNFPGYDLVIAKGGPKLKEATPDPNAPAPDASTPVRPKRNPDGSLTFPPGPRMAFSRGMGAYRMQAQEQPISALVQDLRSSIPTALGADIMDFSVPRARVTDKTGLTRKYDFTLQFACEGCKGLGAMAADLPLLAGRAQAETPAAASDPGNGLPTIFTAIEKQLGLKLEKTKDVPLDVIVVDHVDKVLAGN